MAQNYFDTLLNDHQLIEKGLNLLEKQVEKGEKLDTNITKAVLEFLWDFGEKCHNMREEKIYFPLLIDRGIPPMGPIMVMLKEHEIEREDIAILKDMITQFEDTKILPENFKSTAMDYLNLTKEHIWKENDILYPMGKRVIQPEDEAYLEVEFLKIEKNSVGEGGYNRFFILVNTLEKQAGERVNLISSLPHEMITNMLDAIPVELSFVDADDRVRYFNKLYEKKIFTRSLSVVGRTVQQCHPAKSVHLVNQILAEMKAGTRDKASFWIDFETMFVHISYFAVRDESGNYQGCVEMVHDIKPYRDLEGQKRLLDEE
jgi:uncharacterized protein